MGGVFESIFGGDDETRVEYTYPPEATATIQRLIEISRQLESLIPSLEPHLKDIYQTLYNQLTQYISQFPERLRQLEAEREAKTTDIYEKAKREIKDVTADVKEDVLRKLYRDLSIQGLIGSRASTEAIGETFRRLELEPQLNLIEGKTKSLTGLTNLGTSALIDYLTSLPQFYSMIADTQKGAITMPWGLRKEIMGALTGIGQLAGSLATPVVHQPQPGLLSQILPIATSFALGKIFF